MKIKETIEKRFCQTDSLEYFIELLQQRLGEIPEESRKSALIRMAPEEVYFERGERESYPAHFEITYMREETESEEACRELCEATRQAKRKANRLKQYQKLKKEFE